MNRATAARVVAEEIDEAPVEARIAAIETDVSHIRIDIADMKADIRDLRGDTKVANQAIGALRTECAKQFAELKGDDSTLRAECAKQYAELKGDNATLRESINALRAEMRGAFRLAIATSTIGQLLTAGVILGVVGRALKWF